jgi:[protein-PII] uridylyltransferase
MKQRGAQTPDPSSSEAASVGSADPVTDLPAARESLLARGAGELDSAALRQAWGDLHESWLIFDRGDRLAGPSRAGALL